MEIFISWSGSRSRAWAEALCNWLPHCIQALRPWISSHDIDKGARWGAELEARLEKTSFGIVCLTPENLQEPWLHFESGAISKVKEARVCTLLIDLAPSDVSFPLAQFQATLTTQDDLFQLLQNINVACGENALSETALANTFEVWWPKLDEKIKKIGKPTTAVSSRRPDRELLEEILSAVRSNSALDLERMAMMLSETREMAYRERLAMQELIVDRERQTYNPADYVRFASEFLKSSGLRGGAGRKDGNGMTRVEVTVAGVAPLSIEFPSETPAYEGILRVAKAMTRLIDTVKPQAI